MSLYTQYFNLNAAAAATGGAVTLSLTFSNINAAPGATTSPGLTATVATGIPTPIVDANGLAVEIKPYLNFDDISQLQWAPEDQSFMNYAVATNSAALANIGGATSFVVGATTFAVGAAPAYPDATAAFNAAMNALFTSTLDTAGGRAAIQMVTIDTFTKDMTTAASTNPLFTPTTATVVNEPWTLNAHTSQSPQEWGPGPSPTSFESYFESIELAGNLNLTGAQLNGLLRLKVALGSDPAIGDVEFFENIPTYSSGLAAKLNGQANVLDYDPVTDSFFDPDFTVTAGQPFVFNTAGGAVVPGGLTAGTVYFAVNVSDGTFQLSSTPGGGVIDLVGKTITASSSATTSSASGVITLTGHGFMEGDQVKFTGAATAGGLTPGATYFVLNSDDNTFQLSIDGSSPLPLSAATGLALVNLTMPAGYVHALTPTDVSNIAFSATANGAITFANGWDLTPGQSIIFGSAIGTAVVAGTEYFVKQVNGDGTFTISATYAKNSNNEFVPGAAVTNATATSGSIIAGLDNGGEGGAWFGIAGYQTNGENSDTTAGVFIKGVTLDFPSKIAVANSASSAPQFSALPVDIATINALGSLGEGLTLTLNMTPQTANPGFKQVSQFMSVSLAQADAIAANGISLNLVGLYPKEEAYLPQPINEEASFAPTSIFKIRDTAANLQSMTVEQANNLDAFIHSIQGGESNNFGPQFIDITPLNATGGVDTVTPINLSFDVAQALANNGIRINLGAQVATTVGGGFGTITGEDLLHLVEAGVDRIGFDNSTLPPVAPATVGVDPFAGQNVRSVVLSSQDLVPISKMNIVGLKGNTTIDVAVVVDDSNGSVMVPGALLAKMGVDRIVADDGMLDIHLNDARNLLKVTKDNATPPMLGNVGDKSDVNLIIDMDRDFANTKAPVIAQYAKSGIDIISYEGNLNFLNSLSQSKNLIDTVSAGARSGIGFNLEGDIHLNIGVLSSAGIGANLLATVNSLDDHIFINSRDSDSYQTYEGSQQLAYNQIELLASGVRSDWVSINNMSLVWGDGYSDSWGDNPWNSANYETVLNKFASMTKVVAKANAAPGAAVLVDMQDYSDSDYGSSAGNILRQIWDQNGETSLKREMAEFGKTVFGIKNLYADFRVSGDDWNQVTDNSQFQSDLITNFSKMGFKGIVVDENSVNDYGLLENNFNYDVGRDTDFGQSYDVLPIAQFAQSLDIVYQLDAASSSSSVGLSSYLYENGTVTDILKEDYVSEFKSNVGAIDRIIITNGQDGDLSLDLSAFGVYGGGWRSSTTTQIIDPVNGGVIEYDTTKVNDSNFAAMITHTVNGGKATTANDMFEIRTSAGKYVAVQIVGLTDWTQFNAADLKDASHIGPNVFLD